MQRERVQDQYPWTWELPLVVIRVDQAVMLQIGTAVRQLTGRPEPTEPSHVRLDVLLRSGLGQAVLVANLTGEPAAHAAAARISRLSLDLSWTSLVTHAGEHFGDVVGDHGFGLELLAGQSDGDVLQGA